MSQITYSGTVGDKTVLRFTADFSTGGEYDWSYVVFRGGSGLDDFTALAFRKGGNHIMMLSRAGGVWYSYDDSNGTIISGTETVKNCELGSSPVAFGDTNDMTIASSLTEVKVYLNETLIYESPLTLKLPSAAGIFAFGAASGNPYLKLSNINCYTVNEFVGPNGIVTEDMSAVISADSKATNPWKDSTSPEYEDGDFTFDSATNKGSLGIAKDDYLITRLSMSDCIFPETILQFTADISAGGDADWNYVVFRGNDKFGDFTALAFRKLFGHVMMVSRVTNKWYTYDNSNGEIFAGYETEKNCDIVASSVLSSQVGNLINMTICSTEDSVTVYVNDTKIYESALTLPLPPAVGIMGFGGISGNPKLKLSNLQCYSKDYTQWNNAVNSDSIVYSPFGGGGAQSEIRADGATLTAGSSINGTAAFTVPDLKGRTVVQTYSFSMDSDEIWDWYRVLVRASDDLSDYLVFQIRRGFGHFALYGKINGYNCTYAAEPFADKNIPIFTLGRLTNEASIDKGTMINLTIVTDDDGCTVYESGQMIYEVKFDAMKLEDPSGSLNGLDLSKFKEYVNVLSPAVGMFGCGPDYINRGYIAGEYTGINCYYSGNEVSATQHLTFLTDVLYKGQALEGFASGSFEYDITIGTAETADREALTYTAGSGVNAGTITVEWRTEDKFGYEQAVITMKAGEGDNITRTYIITFEKYDAPKPFVREVWGADAALPV